MPPSSILLPLSLSLCFLLPALAEPLHFDLARRAPAGVHDLNYYAAAAEHLRGKYGLAKSVAIKGRAAADINMVNQQIDASYFATVNIGTPPQPFSVILDTGSSDLWVADSSCTTCTRATPVFNAASSSSLQLSQFGTNIKYGSGEVAGQIGQDVVSMGGFTVQNQTFLAVDTLTDGLLDGRVSGILGLAFSTIASTRSIPFWQTLAASGQLTTPEMGFWMTRVRGDPTAREEEYGGVFTLGGTNTSLYDGDIEFLDMPGRTPTFWLLNLKSITVQGNNVPVTQASALSAIDTGTTLIGGPTKDVQAIYAAIPGSQPVTSMRGFYSFPCTTKPALSLSFGGQSWPINPTDMNLGRLATGSSQCVGGIFDLSLGSNIVSGGGNPNWVVGATFLKNVYSVYRASPPQVGFARLSSAAGGSGAPVSGSGSGTGSNPSPTSGSGGGVRNGAVNTKPAAAAAFVVAMAGLFSLLL